MGILVKVLVFMMFIKSSVLGEKASGYTVGNVQSPAPHWDYIAVTSSSST